MGPLISRLIPILLHPKAPRSLHENAAVSIGRIGLMHPALVAPLLPEFAQAWCQAMYEIRDNEEKDSAFRGLCTLVQTNPAGISKVCLVFFLVSCVSHGSTILTESSVVLQRHRPLEQPITGTQRDVPTIADGIQAARCCWLGGSDCVLPSCDPGTDGTAVRGINNRAAQSLSQRPFCIKLLTAIRTQSSSVSRRFSLHR